MKYLLSTLFIISIVSNTAASQSLAGNWYSEDHTRIYRIYLTEAGYESVLLKTSRAGEKAGVFILKDVKLSKSRSRYKGMILSAGGDMSTQARIHYADKEGKIIRLQLRRMYVTNVNINWYRAEDDNPQLTASTKK